MRVIGQLIGNWSEGIPLRKSATWFRWGVYAIVIYHLLISIPVAHLLWGEHSLVLPLQFSSLWTNRFAMFLHESSHAWLYPFFIISVFAGVLIHAFTRYVRIGAILVYVGMMVLYNRSYMYLTGGNYLLHSLLFYLIFLDERNHWSGRREIASTIVSNFAIWACRIQIIIVYVFTTLYKLAGEKWRNGDAVYHITHVDEFTLPWFEHSVANVYPLMVAFNYLALIYFITFPFMVWSRRWKIPLLIFGVCFHLGLGYVIGVMDFSFTMVVSYIIFLDEVDIERIVGWFPGEKRAVAHP